MSEEQIKDELDIEIIEIGFENEEEQDEMPASAEVTEVSTETETEDTEDSIEPAEVSEKTIETEAAEATEVETAEEPEKSTEVEITEEPEKSTEVEITEELEESFEYKSAEMDSPANKGRNFVRELFHYVIIIAVAFIVAVALNNFVIMNAHVPTTSMENTINAGDRLVGVRLAYQFNEPQRGDIIIFRFPDDETQLYVKRIIGVPGDHVAILDGELYVNGEVVTEDYLKEPMVGTFGPYEVPEGCYFVLGDNRNISEDARYWENTYVTYEQIMAKVWVRYSPSFANLWN